MKDCEPSSGLTLAKEAEKFHECFLEKQEELNKRIAASGTIPQETLGAHFSQLNSMLQNLHLLYSSSSPYLKIYYRKIYQESLQSLQQKIQEAESKFVPRKKFGFKNKRNKSESSGSKSHVQENYVKIEGNKIDVTDGVETYVLKDQKDSNVTLLASSVSGKAVLLSKLTDCVIEIQGAPNTLHIADVSGCTISCGPVTTSVFVEVARSSQFQFACQQLRIHQTYFSDFRIHVTSKAIIEECRDVRFGEYSFTYPTIEEDFGAAGISRDINNWRYVDDFNWLVVDQPSPNWSLIDSSVS